MLRLPDIGLGFPIEIKRGKEDVYERPALYFHKGKRYRSGYNNERENDPYPKLQNEVKQRCKPNASAHIEKLPQGKRAYDLILRFYELWDLKLHALIIVPIRP